MLKIAIIGQKDLIISQFLNLCEEAKKNYQIEYFSLEEEFDYYFKKNYKSKKITEFNPENFDLIINESNDLENFENLLESIIKSEKYFINCDPLSDLPEFYSEQWNFEKLIKNPSSIFIVLNNFINLNFNIQHLNVTTYESASSYGKKELNKFFKELKSFQFSSSNFENAIALNAIFKNTNILEKELEKINNMTFCINQCQVSCALGTLLLLNFESKLPYEKILEKIEKSHFIYLQNHLTDLKCSNEQEIFAANLKKSANWYSLELGFDGIKLQAMNIFLIVEKLEI